MLFSNKKKAWEFWLSAWAHSVLYVLNIKLKISGLENIKGPAIVAMNHQSIIDVFVLPAVAPRKATFLAKKEVSKIPLVAFGMKAGGCIFVDRKSTANAIKSIDKGLKKLPKDYSILIFPEGTRSRNFKLQKLKKGIFHIALQSKLPIVPIGYYGMEQIGGGDNNFFFKPRTLYLHANRKIDTSSWTRDHLETHIKTIETSLEESVAISKKNYSKDQSNL